MLGKKRPQGRQGIRIERVPLGRPGDMNHVAHGRDFEEEPASLGRVQIARRRAISTARFDRYAAAVGGPSTFPAHTQHP
jgi:hypothetical protein